MECWASGKDFLAELPRQQPEAIVLDLMMPDLDGFGVLEELRSNPKAADLPVIIMTAKMLTGGDIARLQGRIRTVIQKNGLSRDRALGELIEHLRTLKQQMVPS